MDVTSALLNAIAQMPIVVVLIFVMISQTKAHQGSIEYYRSQHEAMLKWVLSHADNHISYIPPQDGKSDAILAAQN